MGNGTSELCCSSKVEAPMVFRPRADWKIHFDIMLSFLSQARLWLCTKTVETVPVSSQSVGPNNGSPASFQLWRENQPTIGRLKQWSLDQLALNWQKSLRLPGGRVRMGLFSVPSKQHTVLQGASSATSLCVFSARISTRSPLSAVAVLAFRGTLKFLRINSPPNFSCVALWNSQAL